VIEVDIMGERIRILRMLPVVPDQNLELDLPAVFKLPPGYTTIPGQELQIGITAMNVAEPMGPEGFLSLEARILNPGPFYWECGAGEGVCLGVGEEDEGLTSIHCFDLPRDLFPGDEVMVPVRLFLPRGMDSAAFYLNGAIRPGGKNERWFPEFNRVVIPNYPDK
jgi:hypothetical protein